MGLYDQQPRAGKGLVLPFTKASNSEANQEDSDYRLPLLHRVPDSVRNHFVAMTGEFVGTVLFLYFALSGTQVANSIPSSAGLTVAQTGSNPQQLQYIALCFGFSLAVNAWVFFRISGGLFNPAVTIGMCLIGALPWIRGVLLFIAQILGGMAAAALVSCMFPGALNVRTKLGGGTSVVQGLFIEMILTAELVFAIFMLAAEKHKGTFIAPVGIGLALFIAELTGVYFTGGSLNPARSFGPALVEHDFSGHHWIYWIGPILGSLVAAGFYKFIKGLEYETANPGQDGSHEETKQRLMDAGVSADDAHVQAQGMTGKRGGGENGGIDGTSMAHGQGRLNQPNDAMYGSGLRNTTSAGPGPLPNSGSDAAHNTQAGQPNDVGLAGRVGSTKGGSVAAGGAANDISASHADPAGERLGGFVAGDHEPRSRFARTARSGI